MTTSGIHVDGLLPGRILRPQSIEELSQLVAEEKGAIVPAGQGTQLDAGNPLRRLDCLLDLTGLSRITEYNPADLTIHVEAGVTLDRLQRTLLDNNQFLPLDPWNGPTATLGGIAATNAQGPYRAAGTLRDWIIGMRVVHVDGHLSKTGGRVVKNVTGYDLAKLYTGSFGSLVIIAEISLKLRANFGRTSSLVARFKDQATAVAAIEAIRKGALQPVSCVWSGPENALWLRFSEHPKAVEWQAQNLPPADWTPVDENAWEGLRQEYHRMGPVLVKVIGMPSEVARLVEICGPKAWIAHALNGVVYMSVQDSDDVLRIRRAYRAVVERAPMEVRRQVGAFGLTETEYRLMRKMKDTFDPGGRLSPGRHVDGEVQNS